MKHALAGAAICLIVGGCGKGFVGLRDYGRVAECYAAFFSVHMDAQDPALGFSAGEIDTEANVTAQGINRMTPFIVEAEKRAGGDKKFLALVSAWRGRKENDIRQAATPTAKHAVYQHVLAEASKCQQTLNQWGAAKDYRAPQPAS
jgi:hypothetical protein